MEGHVDLFCFLLTESVKPKSGKRKNTGRLLHGQSRHCAIATSNRHSARVLRGADVGSARRGRFEGAKLQRLPSRTHQSVRYFRRREDHTPDRRVHSPRGGVITTGQNTAMVSKDAPAWETLWTSTDAGSGAPMGAIVLRSSVWLQ